MTAVGTRATDRSSRAQPAGIPDEHRYDADVIVVGAGPAGSSAAYWLATAGLDVLLLEKTTFPREKVCGDGLTPRGTRALVEMGIDVSEAGRLAAQQAGCASSAAGQRLHLDWPELTSFPSYGLVRPRADLDAHAGQPGRQGRRAAVRADHRHRAGPRPHRTGSSASMPPPDADKKPVTYRAPVVLTCEGVSGKLAQRLGVHRNDKRPLGVAVRRYYTSPKTHDDYLESWLELWDGKPVRTTPTCCPATAGSSAWATARSTPGSGVLNSSAGFQKTDYRGDAHPLAGQHARGVGPARAERDLPDPRRGACRWASTAHRTTCAGCCSSATAAAR